MCYVVYMFFFCVHAVLIPFAGHAYRSVLVNAMHSAAKLYQDDCIYFYRFDCHSHAYVLLLFFE